MPYRHFYRLGQDAPSAVTLIPVMHSDGSITYEVPSGPAAIAGNAVGLWLRANWGWLAGGLLGFLVLKKNLD